MKQLIKMMPLEPYAFGTDQKFRYPGEKSTGKESYFVKAQVVPEQTTILGTLRLMVLKQKGLFHSDFRYTEEEQMQMAQYIGPESFRFSQRKQDFGCIHKISPVFLMDSRGSYYIKNPFHNIEQKKGYSAMVLSDKIMETSFGKIRLPEKDEYHAKNGHATGYYNLSNGDIHKDLFSSVVLPGNRKNNKISEEDCFFRRELFILKKGYCFAVFVDADELFQTQIVSMGMGSCTFLVTSEANREDDLEKYIEKAFCRNECNGEDKDVWWYALSDLVVQSQSQQQSSGADEERYVYEAFCIVEQKQMRNLNTRYSEKRRLQKLKLSENQVNLIQSGSVFFENCGLDLDNENCRQVGYNRIVKLGGNVHAGNVI